MYLLLDAIRHKTSQKEEEDGSGVALDP